MSTGARAPSGKPVGPSERESRLKRNDISGLQNIPRLNSSFVITISRVEFSSGGAKRPQILRTVSRSDRLTLASQPDSLGPHPPVTPSTLSFLPSTP
ncbi:PREDICTED: ATPase inhibitor, mitochondrial isoform X2 [Cercocebus atys]|uniref:ATPase inhibitor, mitochondrial isoform X2 n=1 Tax=Cercocebus atys TaxID=9531 RepID=UPI0005F53E69|nr:PREDICTED: ATPase inhibitor, mitochondrial isoform X2 [Cercocebus atys]